MKYPKLDISCTSTMTMTHGVATNVTKLLLHASSPQPNAFSLNNCFMAIIQVRSTWTERFCWSKVLLLACPCWWQL